MRGLPATGYGLGARGWEMSTFKIETEIKWWTLEQEIIAWMKLAPQPTRQV